MSSLLKIGVSAAVLATSAVGLPGFEGVPLLGASQAEAGRYYRGHRHRDNFDVGDAIVGGLVVGGLIAILSSASKKDKDRRGDDDYPRDPRWEPRGDWDRGRDGDWSWADRDWERRTSSERRAIETCAREAEDLGSRYREEARVRTIRDVDRDGSEYRVKGVVDTRDDDERGSREFYCYVRDDRITDFQFETGYAAR